MKPFKKNEQEAPTLIKEMRSTGSVSSRVYDSYLGSGTCWAGLLVLVMSNIICQGLFSFSDIWLKFWTESENMMEEKATNNTHGLPPPHQILDRNGEFTASGSVEDGSSPQFFNLGIYGAIVVSLCAASLGRSIYFFVTCMNTSIKLHDDMFRSVTRAPCRFFETNPVGRKNSITQ